MTADTPSLDMQIASVKREIALRMRVYPKWVAAKRMTQAEADKEIGSMTAALHSLMKVSAMVKALLERCTLQSDELTECVLCCRMWPTVEGPHHAEDCALHGVTP
jgi:hypothetical protein